MKTAINNNYTMRSAQRNDIFRKFQEPFRYLLNDSLGYDEKLYVEQASTRYEEEFDVFTNSVSSDVRYFIGYTGCGKSTFIRHYFGLDNAAPKMRNSNQELIVPSVWNSKKIVFDNKTTIVRHIEGNINAAMRAIDSKKALSFPYYDLDDFTEYIEETKGDILSSLTPEEILELNADEKKMTARVLSHSKEKEPLDYNCAALRYFIEEYSNINRLIFIIDDVETLNIRSLHFLVDEYYHIYDYFNNVGKKPITVNLLISLRPHSFRYLKENCLSHEQIISYGNHLESRCYHIIKNDIPNIREIFTKRFDYYANKIKPGNKDTWKTAKNNLFNLVNKIEDYYVDVLVDLCHMNIRAIFDCLQLILSNRIWCQDAISPSPYPTVNPREYRFNDLLNLLRTLSCGENSVYTGSKDQQFNSNDLIELQPRPRFDGSEVFIPNIINDRIKREIDLTAIYIMYYLENKFSSTDNTPVNTEYIKMEDLLKEIETILNLTDAENEDKIENIIKELFKNRIIRKSIHDHDTDQTIETVDRNTFLYFTRKGSRLLKLFKENSVLLEIYREDIVRKYKDPNYCKSSFELVLKQRRDILFEDLIELAKEIFIAEDALITQAAQSNSIAFVGFIKDFKLTNDICEGLINTFRYVKGLNADPYVKAIENLKNEIIRRKVELIK